MTQSCSKGKFGLVLGSGLCMLALAGSVSATGSTADAIFSDVERTIIKRYFERQTSRELQPESRVSKPTKRGKHRGKGKTKAKKLPPGLAKRDQLPPGLAKRETLPPGLRRQPLPRDLRLSLPEPRIGTQRLLIEGRTVLIEKATNRVLDSLEDAIAR